eukprot:CAMPEP_0114234996 /NCGR_PEP_ID=MMETSP0058-20121206/6005_1 /TAXON_ID=36894 /ORGANISM="Pyramimonas parkeae, CCMP726" /LENGTH=534 /DNA_ID=CAMNT_0001346709 /DNA_START=56 /DNA_END=1661 /DNA_ORIENTATION=+
MSLNKEATKKPVRPHTEHALLTSTTSTSTAPSRSKKSSNPQSARERSTGSSSGGVKMYYDATCAQPPHEPASAVVVPASSNRSVAPHVLSQFISKVGNSTDMTVTCQGLLAYLNKEGLVFEGGEELVTSMFREADYRHNGLLTMMDLKAALTERFVWRKHNRDWRRMAQFILNKEDISDPAVMDAANVQVPVFVGLNTPKKEQGRVKRGARAVSAHACLKPSCEWTAFREQMQERGRGDGALPPARGEAAQMLTTWGGKSLQPTNMEAQLNRGMRGVGASGAWGSADLDAARVFRAFDKALQFREHQSVMEMRKRASKERPPLYNRPTTAPTASHIKLLMEKREESGERGHGFLLENRMYRSAPTQRKATFAHNPKNKSNFDVCVETGIHQSGFHEGYINPREQTHPFRKPTPGAPLMNEIREHMYMEIADKPLHPASLTDRDTALGYQTDVRSQYRREIEAHICVPSQGAKTLLPTHVESLREDPVAGVAWTPDQGGSHGSYRVEACIRWSWQLMNRTTELLQHHPVGSPMEL